MNSCLISIFQMCLFLNINVTPYRNLHEPFPMNSQADDNYANYLISDSPIMDTSKLPSYIISGSFLVPDNARKRKDKLFQAGINSAYITTFPGSEYYSVVVDSFHTSLDSARLIHKVKKLHIDFFIKRCN